MSEAEQDPISQVSAAFRLPADTQEYFLSASSTANPPAMATMEQAVVRLVSNPRFGLEVVDFVSGGANSRLFLKMRKRYIEAKTSQPGSEFALKDESLSAGIVAENLLGSLAGATTINVTTHLLRRRGRIESPYDVVLAWDEISRRLEAAGGPNVSVPHGEQSAEAGRLEYALGNEPPAMLASVLLRLSKRVGDAERETVRRFLEGDRETVELSTLNRGFFYLAKLVDDAHEQLLAKMRGQLYGAEETADSRVRSSQKLMRGLFRINEGRLPDYHDRVVGLAARNGAELTERAIRWGLFKALAYYAEVFSFDTATLLQAAGLPLTKLEGYSPPAASILSSAQMKQARLLFDPINAIELAEGWNSPSSPEAYRPYRSAAGFLFKLLEPGGAFRSPQDFSGAVEAGMRQLKPLLAPGALDYINARLAADVAKARKVLVAGVGRLPLPYLGSKLALTDQQSRDLHCRTMNGLSFLATRGVEAL